MALPNIEQQAAIEVPQAGVDSWKYQARNSLMYVPEGMQNQPCNLPMYVLKGFSTNLVTH